MGRRTAWYLGSVWMVTWGFWLAGLHTPMSFAAALVGCTGIALVLAAGFDWLEGR